MLGGSILFLKAVLVLAGVGALALLLWEPHIEGRNAHATLLEIYFNDPFLAYAYIASIPFFVGLHQAFKVLEYAGQDAVFSPATIRALRTIRLCAMAIVGFVAVGEIFILLGDSDDRAGGVFIGVLIAFLAIVVAATMVVLERVLKDALAIKLGSDLKG
jgi:hypothetical protein